MASSGDAPEYKINRTRQEVEDKHLLQLAGMVAYTPKGAQEGVSLLDMSLEELRRLA